MTYEEAIKWVDNRLCLGRYTPTIHNPFNKDECYEAGMVAIEALEKQIPKKLINFSCPVCSHYFEDGDTSNYCPNCGQRLE